MTSAAGQPLGVLVIGVGHAGVALGYCLAPAGQRFQTVDAGRVVSFADRAASEFDTVIRASGHGTDHSWMDVPAAKDEFGRVSHTRGVTPSPGLYVLGLTWQHIRGSALLGWVGKYAAITGQISPVPGREQPQ